MNYFEIVLKVMMTPIKYKRKFTKSKEFKKGLRKAEKQGKDLVLLNSLIKLLANDEPLPKKYQDHKLHDKDSDFRELHIQKDWINIL